MLQEMPSALRLLLEAPLEEELYTDWSSLLETLTTSYPPPTLHLGLCMTLLVHPQGDNDSALRASCTRILLNCLEVYGSRIFRDAMTFQPARLKRRKVRHSLTGLEREYDEELDHESQLMTTESVFHQFTSFWEFLKCALAQDLFTAHNWGTLLAHLILIIEDDWNLHVTGRLDLTKTLAVQFLRSGDEKRVDVRKIVKSILYRAEDAPESTALDPYHNSRLILGDAQARSSNQYSFCSRQSMLVRHSLIDLLLKVSQAQKLGILSEVEIISNLANTITSLPLSATVEFFDFRKNAFTETQLPAMLNLCNVLLFRLAAFPAAYGTPGDRKVDWNRVQGWCAAESRSNDSLEVCTVEYLKCAILTFYLRTSVRPVSQRRAAGNALLTGMKHAQAEILDRSDFKTSDSGPQQENSLTMTFVEDLFRSCEIEILLAQHAF